jgi:acyl-coenzyme A synthetase/AMP-(fatty) acid ligase
MIVDPNANESRKKYLLDQSDYSLLITDNGLEERYGADYGNEKLFWYTSGTTGDSKFCSFTQAQLNSMSSIIIKSYELSANDRYVSIMPLWHAHGQGFYWATRLAGCETKFVKIKDIKSIVNYSPTFITAIPNVLKLLTNFKIDAVRFIRSASTALPINLYQELLSRYNVPIVEAFGMTEAMSHCFTNPLNGERRPGTVGLPDGIEADIVDSKLYIKGPNVFRPGWYDTGDLAEQDSAGYYRIVGRSKDQININGIKINPISIESQLLTNLPEITECIIFGSTEVKCLYVGSCTVSEVSKFLTSLGKHCRPKLLKSIESIPVSPSGKVSRTWLDKEFTL